MHNVLAGVLPDVHVAAHSLQVYVWGGHGDGQLPPEDQEWWAQPHFCTGRHILPAEPEQVNIKHYKFHQWRNEKANV